MKRRHAIFLLLLAVLGLALWFWPSEAPAPAVAEAPRAAPGAEPRPVAAILPTEELSPEIGLPPVLPPSITYDPNDPRWEWWRRAGALDPHFEWKMPLSFYGIVVDETDTPVPEVSVRMTWTDLTPNGSSRIEVLTDDSGLFSLTGESGKRLVVSVLDKEGYDVAKASNSTSFEYAAFFESNYHHPDPANPVVFRMRKKGETEPLLHRVTLYGLPLDGTPSYFNLRSGRKTLGGEPTGDLVIRFIRATDDAERPSWRLTIEGVAEAELIESNEEFMYLAPDAGYAQVIQVERISSSPDYQSQLSRQFYVRLADGSAYARIETRLYSKYNDGAAISIRLWLNPSGSRNLEDDPAKRIE